MKRVCSFLVFAAVHCCLILVPGPSHALRSFMLEPGVDVYGVTRLVQAREKDTLLDIAREFGLGYNQIVAANPGIDPWVPKQGSLVNLTFMAPWDHSETGFVVNLAEMRLYFFFANGGHEFFFTAPIGIGREGYLTDTGEYTVKSKTPNPTWVVPESIRAEEPDLPAQVLPGPDNPLGDFVFRLSRNLYAIHGTNKPWGIGRRVSHGCIRMYPEDVGALYPLVPVGAAVRVIYEPVKFGWGDGRLWVQVFEDFEGRMDSPLEKVMEAMLHFETAKGPLDLDREALSKALEEKSGVPVAVGRLRDE
jgi:L,D-transpeptidase ErfK/SrfK